MGVEARIKYLCVYVFSVLLSVRMGVIQAEPLRTRLMCYYRYSRYQQQHLPSTKIILLIFNLNTR